MMLFLVNRGKDKTGERNLKPSHNSEIEHKLDKVIVLEKKFTLTSANAQLCVRYSGDILLNFQLRRYY